MRRRYLRNRFASKERLCSRGNDAYVVPDTISLIETTRTVGLKSRFDHGLVICLGIKAIHRHPILCGQCPINTAGNTFTAQKRAEALDPFKSERPYQRNFCCFHKQHHQLGRSLGFGCTQVAGGAVIGAGIPALRRSPAARFHTLLRSECIPSRIKWTLAAKNG